MANDDLASLRKKRKRKSKRRSLLIAAVSIFLLALLITALLLVLDSRAPNLRLAFFNQGSIEKTIKGKGLILRDEELLYAPQGGYLYPLYASGSKISSTDQIAVVLNSGHIDIADKLQLLEKDIYLRQLVLLKNKNVQPGFLESIKKSKNEVSKTIASARIVAGSGDIAAIEIARTGIGESATFNIESASKINFDDKELNELMAQYNLLLGSLRGGEYGSVIASAEAGLVSYCRTLNTENGINDWQDLNAEQLKKRLAMTNEARGANYPFEIETGAAAMSLITSKEHYLAFLLPDLKSADLSFERRYKIESLSQDIGMTNCELVRCEATADGLLAVFKTREALDAYADYCQDEFSISLSRHNGLMLPISSLLDISEDQRAAKIMKVVGGKTVIVPVVIEATDGFYVLVRGRDGDKLAPREADIYVRNPEKVEAGIIID